MRLEWLGHASFVLEGDIRIYIDPFKISGKPADIIFITHTHADHLDPESLERIVTPETMIVCSSDAVGSLSSFGAEIIPLEPGESTLVRGVHVKATHAYNLDKEFHPSENDWLGFIITVADLTVFCTGDLDDLPELYGLSCDVLLLPVSGTYVMDANQAAHFAEHIEYRRAIPMHFGSIVGTVEDAERFVSLAHDAVVPVKGVDLLEGL